jgi:quercetin dioxygenase-like cupin family protein
MIGLVTSLESTLTDPANWTKERIGGTHTHTNDVWIVVLKGAYLYKDDVIDKRLVVASGSFLRVPAGMKHWSGGDPKEGALFYEESSGKFDSIPAK